MKIVRYQKKKDGKYLLQLENGVEVETYEDLILKYDLLIKKGISSQELTKIQEENQEYELYFVALHYLKVKPRSVRDTVSYLQKKGSSLLADSVIKRLKKQGYLDDYRYASSLVHEKILTTSEGPLKILEHLQSLEIQEEEKEKLLKEFTPSLEKERIEKIVLKLVRSNHSKSNYLLRQKIRQYLIQQGYHAEQIDEKLSLVTQDETSIYQKEYQKLYRKLCRKYEGKELEYQIKQKLYQKGFRGGLE